MFLLTEDENYLKNTIIAGKKSAIIQFEKVNTKNFPLIVLFSGFRLLFFAHDYEKR